MIGLPLGVAAMPVLIAVCAWVILFLVAAIGMMTTSELKPVNAEIVLEEMPFCTYFVMKAPQGFVLAEVTESSTALLAGWLVYGLKAESTGAQKVEIQGHGQTTIIVEKVGIQRAQVAPLYDQYCPTAPTPAPGWLEDPGITAR
jgi:hypothetical protein